MEYFRLRLHDIRYSNKPAIRLKAIRERKNSLRSNNILSLINAAPQALTISNVPTQSPAAFPSPPVPKCSSKGLYPFDFLRFLTRKCLPDNHGIYRKLVARVDFIDEVPFSSDFYECLLRNDAAAEKCTDRMRQ